MSDHQSEKVETTTTTTTAIAYDATTAVAVEEATTDSGERFVMTEKIASEVQVIESRTTTTTTTFEEAVVEDRLFSKEEVADPSRIRALVDKVLEFYQGDKLFMAYDLLIKIERSIAAHFESEEQRDFLTQALQEHEYRLLNQIKKETNDVNMLVEEFENQEGWISTYDGTATDGIKAFYRNEPGSHLHSLKLEAVVDCPMFHVLSVFYEADLYKTWVPQMRDSMILERQGKFRFLCYFTWNLPWPMYDRDLCAYGYGVDILEKNSIVVVIRSVNENTWRSNYSKVPKEPYRTTRIECDLAGFIITPISSDKTLVKIISRCDPKLSYVPWSFQNMVQSKLAPLVMVRIRQASARVASSPDYLQRIKENAAAVYGDIQQRLDNYFKTSSNNSSSSSKKEEKETTTTITATAIAISTTTTTL